MAKYLTKRQIDFCNNVIDGMSLKDAYIAAGYSVTKYSDKKIADLGSLTMSRPEIKEYIAEQREILSRVTRITKEKSLISISETVQIAIEEYKNKKDPAQAQVFFRGMDMINRMLGHYEATKTEHTGNININFSIPEPDYVEMKKEAVDIQPIEKEDD